MVNLQSPPGSRWVEPSLVAGLSVVLAVSVLVLAVMLSGRRARRPQG
ncbi:hypothetical protein [Cryptosporangium aurantiacum]|uniref:Uncharacterized protein n=1 Tax=Cryptosporangium aurantiacum TaxID=134849 RepID=A0A1M7RP32_9ACTN|nr:hypothetical protein [Cryptosporangium aurantiacum]SHN48085.1 hypothetical protein SAMN05443668_13332 [Cryptosporangium aurantiacum]